MVAMFAAKNYVLWGNKCGFYLALLDIVETLKLESVEGMSELFKMYICRQILWALYEDISQYFSVKLTPDIFSQANPHRPVAFPQSRLAGILACLVNGQRPYRVMFPHQWKTTRNTGEGVDEQSEATVTATIATRSRAWSRQSQGGGYQGGGYQGGQHDNNNNQGGGYGGNDNDNGQNRWQQQDQGNYGPPQGQNGGQQQPTMTHLGTLPPYGKGTL